MIDVNIKGVLYGIAAVLSYMKEQKSGTLSMFPQSRDTRSDLASLFTPPTKHAVRGVV